MLGAVSIRPAEMLGPHAILLIPLMIIFARQEAVQSENILALINLASPSHYFFNRALTRSLAARGHQVTELGRDTDRGPVPNLTLIPHGGFYSALVPDFDFDKDASQSTSQTMVTLAHFAAISCEMFLESPAGQKLLNYPYNEPFDLIIIEGGWTECFYGFIPKFGSPPVVVLSPYGLTPWISSATGFPTNPSYEPFNSLPFTSHMTFTQRLINFVTHVVLNTIYKQMSVPKLEALRREHFKETEPSFSDIERNFSIYLVNICLGLDDPRPLPANVIPVGGMHVKEKTNPLPKDLKQFLDEAKEGFIYFSMGTNFNGSKLREDKRKALMSAFSELPQRVVWKFEANSPPETPPNVLVSKWLPQSDILAHPNIRMFISHCGRLSTIEAVYRGVPVVGVPIMIDQTSNLQLLISKNVAVKLDFLTLTKESVLAAVREILDNDSYRTNMRRLSAVFRDQPQTPLDRAVYWTEYVIRHKGAPHLRSAAADLSWYQYLLLDVILVFATGALLVVLIIYLAIRTLYKIPTRKPTKRIKTN
ncbi:UDP-glucuronosyltransferase 2B19 [Cryptotermes secundus]|uniref:UDP-glucuronosyltransferase 2B19 n=1 Tax=Cryptotermes secundus TaxID=105785 RepID=A0A2J7PYT3_9NEOP|nr:UDP-glucuronosyltransferase 2C1 [Cryptotermes secundus]PNF21498.1 UDP-glucuronosyltransferase 2B19 [Cryptotermes secundus]